MWRWLQFLVLLAQVYLSLPTPLESTSIEQGDRLEKNFNIDNWSDCWQQSVEEPSKESDESLSDEELPQDHHQRKDRGSKKAKGTSYKNGIVNSARRNSRKKKKYLLLATAAIAAKAASVATALTIILPLALKIITLLAAKSFFVGTLAILMTSFLGFSKMVQEPSEQKTVIYLHKDPHMDYNTKFKRYGHFWGDTQGVGGSHKTI